jgi:hypothetical protein
MLILIIFLVIILGVIIWGGVTQWKFVNKKPENFNNDIKVAILIITLNKKWIKDKRWKGEREIWEKYADKNKNVDCYFLECDKKEYYTTLKNDCKESNQPGIYQKTIQSLKNLEKDYDFYIRTNTRMFFIFDNLLKQLKSLKRDKPYLYGGYCTPYTGALGVFAHWIGGFLFILNKKTKDLIVKKGFDKKYYSAKIPDDVLLGQVLTDNGVKCEKDSTVDFSLGWNSNKSFEENVKNIDNSGKSMIYLNYDTTVDLRKKLLNYFYKL